MSTAENIHRRRTRRCEGECVRCGSLMREMNRERVGATGRSPLPSFSREQRDGAKQRRQH